LFKFGIEYYVHAVIISYILLSVQGPTLLHL